MKNKSKMTGAVRGGSKAAGLTLIEFIIFVVIIGVCLFSVTQATASGLVLMFVTPFVILLWFGFSHLWDSYARLAHNWRMKKIKNFDL